MKILIIQTAFIGDVVLALPIAQAFNLYLPQAEIHFLVRKGNENLLENHPSIHKIWSWDKKNKWSSVVKLLKAFRKERFTWVINPHRFLSSGIFTVFSKAKYTVGFEKNPLSWLFDYRLKHEIREGLHEVQRNLSLLKPVLNTDVPLIKPNLYPSDADRAKVKMYQKEPYVVLAPASVWYTKQWEISNWIELAQKLSEKYWVYLVGGPSDGELCEKIKSSNERIVNLSGKLTYLQTASLMEKAIRVWVNDSAPLHFATAVNAPVTAIFCSTTPRFGFFPLSDDSKILSNETLKCKPCGLHGKKACPQKHFMCSKSITVDMALQM
jgi:heptosyltransferase-2